MKGTETKAPGVPQALIDLVGDHFLEAARYLREIQDAHPKEFVSVAKKLKVGRRKAYELVRIDRRFHDLGIAPDRLRQIGWTKLAHLASHVDADNVEKWLALAETITAHELKMLLRGKVIDPETRAVVLYLDKVQYDIFETALLTAGAIKDSGCLLNREAALTRLLDGVVAE